MSNKKQLKSTTCAFVAWPPYTSYSIVVCESFGDSDLELPTVLSGAGWRQVNVIDDGDRTYRVWRKAGGGTHGQWLPTERDPFLAESIARMQTTGYIPECLNVRDATDGWLAMLSGLPRGKSQKEHGSGFYTVVGDLPPEEELPVAVRLRRPLLVTGMVIVAGTDVEMHWVVPADTLGKAWGLHFDIRLSIDGVDDIKGLRCEDLDRDWPEFYGPHAWWLVLDGDGERVPPDYYEVECKEDGVVFESYSDPWDVADAETMFGRFVNLMEGGDGPTEVTLCRLSRPPLTQFTPPQDPTTRITIRSAVVGGSRS